MTYCWPLVVVCCLFSGATLAAESCETSTHATSIMVNSIRGGEGVIVVMGFDEQGAFSEMNPVKMKVLASVPASAASITVTFENLPMTDYAFAAFHDSNNNGMLDMKGDYPTEGYSYAAMGRSGFAPTFADAVAKPGESVALHLKYWR